MSHICFVTGLYSRYDPIIYYRQAKGLISLGHRVSIIVCDKLPDEERDGIHIYSTHYIPNNRCDRFLNTKKQILRLVDVVDADVYQVQDPEHISMVDYFLKRGKRVIFNMRENYSVLLTKKPYIPWILKKSVGTIYELMMKHFLPKYTAVITVTPKIVSFLTEKYHLNNVYLLPNYPVPNKHFHLSKEEYLKRENVLLYEGTVYRVSRQEIVLDALQGIHNIKYLIAGKIDNDYSEMINHPNWHNVEFINGFDNEDLPDIFARSTISNALRDFGGSDGSLGVIKIFESMDAALPVIFTDVPIYRTIVEKYNCGVLANPNNVDSVRHAILYLVENQEKAYEMGQNGRRAVLEEFNYCKHLELYNKILSL